MRSGRLISFAFGVGLLAFSGPVFAHHGQVEYGSKTVTLQGTVTKFEWVNPHCIIGFAVKNDKDNLEDWYAEFLPPAQMNRAGWTRDSIKPGDQITLVGRPGKKGTHIMWLQYFVTPDGRRFDRDANAR
jgi:hydrogenase maturation factor